MSEAEERNQSDPAAPAPRDSRKPGEGAVEHGARTYGARRRGWIRIHGRDDRLLIFIGVLALSGMLFLVAYNLIEDWREEDHPPVPWAELFAGDAEEIEPGLLRVAYDFATNPKIADDKEATPQLADWWHKGIVEIGGILVSGDNRYRPFFIGDRLSVECDVALLRSRRVSIFLQSPFDYQDNDFYRFDLHASRGKDWPATAQIFEFREASQAQSSDLAQLESLRVRPQPPLFWYRVKFELADGVLRGYFAPKGEELKQVCEMPASDLEVGVILLRGPGAGSRDTAFDNVVIIGRPHPEVIEKRTKFYYLFDQHKRKRVPVTESAPPVAESASPVVESVPSAKR